MKKIILVMLAITPVLLFAQKKYVIKGKLGELNPPARVFLVYSVGDQNITDSATMKNGSFKFTGQVNDITLARLIMDYSGRGLKSISGTADIMALYLEDGNITVFSTDSLAKARLGGTKANEDYARYLAAVKPVINANKALTVEYNSASAEKRNSKDFIESIQKRQLANQQQASDINNQFIIDNPDANISLQILIDKMNAVSYPDPTALQEQFSKLSKNLQQSNSGIAYQKRIDVLKKVEVGAIAPDFTQPDTAGKPVKLSSFRGKYLLVDFWASWCAPCRNENPNVVKAYNDFKEKNFTILGVSLDQPGKKDDWLKAIHTDGLQWSQVSDLKSWGNEVCVLYGVRAIPQNLLIDPDGKIIAKNIFGDELENKLAEVLGE